MKVTVELNRDDEESGFESDYNEVKFATVYADNIEAWAEAIRSFASIGWIVAEKEQLITEALLIDGGYQVGNWNAFVERLDGPVVLQLLAAIEARLSTAERLDS